MLRHVCGNRAMKVRIGDALPVCEIAISQEIIDAYAAISGDFNPIHVDPQAGADSVFGSTIAHGCIPLEPVFQALQRWTGTELLPRDTAIRLRYRAPSRPGDRIRADARVAAESSAHGRRFVVIEFACLNQRDERVIDGKCELVL